MRGGGPRWLRRSQFLLQSTGDSTNQPKMPGNLNPSRTLPGAVSRARHSSHSYRAPARSQTQVGSSSRFIVQQVPTSSGSSSLRRSIQDSAQESASRAVQIQQTARELEAFMSAIDEVERAGPRLHRLPRERLLEIQRTLASGISGPDGVILAPVAQPTSQGGITRTLSHQRDRRAARQRDMERYYDPRTNSIVHWPAAGSASSSRGGHAGDVDAAPQLPAKGLSSLELSLVANSKYYCGPFASNGGEEDQDDVCAICLGAMQAGDCLAALPCAHRYHWECVERWLGVSQLCPLCKTHALGKEYEEARSRERSARAADAAAGAHAPTNPEDASMPVQPWRGTATGDRTPTGHSEEMDEESVQLIENAAAAISASRAASALGLQADYQPARGQQTSPPTPTPPPPPPSRPTQVDGGETRPRVAVLPASHVPAGRLHAAATCATLAQSNPSSRLPTTSISFEASAAAFSMASSAAAAAAVVSAERHAERAPTSASLPSPWAYVGDPRLIREPGTSGAVPVAASGTASGAGLSSGTAAAAPRGRAALIGGSSRAAGPYPPPLPRSGAVAGGPALVPRGSTARSGALVHESALVVDTSRLGLGGRPPRGAAPARGRAEQRPDARA